VDRHGIEMHSGTARFEKLAPSVSLENSFVEWGKARSETRRQIRRHQNWLILGIVDGDALHPLAIAEAFHQPLQVPVSTLRQERLHGLLEAFGHQLSAFFQFIAPGSIVRLHLIEGKENGHDGNGENERKDQAEAKTHSVIFLSDMKFPLRKVNEQGWGQVAWIWVAMNLKDLGSGLGEQVSSEDEIFTDVSSFLLPSG
jgi:hypothetical protein